MPDYHINQAEADVCDIRLLRGPGETVGVIAMSVDDSRVRLRLTRAQVVYLRDVLITSLVHWPAADAEADDEKLCFGDG